MPKDGVGSLAFGDLQELDWQILQRDLMPPQYPGQMNNITCISVWQSDFAVLVLGPWYLQSKSVLLQLPMLEMEIRMAEAGIHLWMSSPATLLKQGQL